MKRLDGNLFYAGMLAVALAGAWLGSRYLGRESDEPFDESRLERILVDVELAPIDLEELPFGFFRPSKRHAPIPGRVRYADDMEVALVQNRNRLLFTTQAQPQESEQLAAADSRASSPHRLRSGSTPASPP